MKNEATVRVQTNTPQLIKNLGYVFSDSKKVLAEMMQNARRAKATEIRFSMEDDILCVEDNGIGIEEFQKLLTIADSGWDNETTSEENPFGLGFLSALFSASRVSVESRGRMVVFETEQVISLHNTPVESTNYIGSTRIRLFGFKLSVSGVESALKMYSRGFGIRVFFNGREFERPHALENITGTQSAVGHLCLNGIDKTGYYPSAIDNLLYFQGLPVGCNHEKGHFNGFNIVHLNNSFSLRMPDRDSLIDVAEAQKKIEGAIKGRWKDFFENLKATQPIQELLSRFTILRDFGFLYILNDVPLLPTQCLVRMRNYPVKNDDFNEFINPLAPISKESIETGAVTVYASVDNNMHDLNGRAFAAKMLAYKLGWFELSGSLDAGHWIYNYLVDFETAAFEILYKPTQSGGYSFETCSGAVALVDSYEIRSGQHSVTVTDEAVTLGDDTGDEDDFENLIIIPHGSNGTEALSQVSAWLDEFDGYREEWREEDERLMENFTAILRGELATETVRKALISEGVAYKKNCNNTVVVSLIGTANNIQCKDLPELLEAFVQHLADNKLLSKDDSFSEAAVRTSAMNFVNDLLNRSALDT
jgi:mannitol/fructose-specific phosphotransferase system IIA component (Ntr-type)